MATSTTDDEVLAQVVASNKLAKPREVDEAREWGRRYHPDKDLGEVLFMRGVLDRSKLALLRRLAKMAKSGAAKRASDEAVVAPTAAEPSVSTEVAKAETRPLPVRPRDLANAPPERVGRYEILEKVAQGGMGVIYKARHPELDRLFAVKLLTPRIQASAEALARFQREAKTAARLDHPNIVRVYDAGTDGGVPYLVMDYVDGPDLDDLVAEEGLGVRKAAQLARALALALEHAHQSGVVHRDIKPENVIIDRATGEPKLTDFGIVKELAGDREEERKLTQTGFTLGSPCYMSPEQAEGLHNIVGPQSDVYSLAATLYEMLTGSPPFDGDSIHAIMTKVVREEPVPVRARNPSVPPQLAVVCMKALEKDLARRYPSARAFAEDLDRFLSDEPVLAKPIGRWTRTARLVRRNKAVTALLALFASSAAVGLGSVWSWQRQLRVDAAALQAERLERALGHLRAAEASEDARSKRRDYYEALQELNAVLRDDPTHEEASSHKREAVLALGDHLIESGEASFAEFVFSLGAGVADEAVIASRVEAARLGVWAERAEAAELRGDVAQAVELYRKGLRTLREAGYTGARLQRRIESLEVVLEERRLRSEVAQLAALGEAAARKGDPAAAYLAFSRALALAPEDHDLEGRARLHRQAALDAVLARRTDVGAARAQIEALPAGEGTEALAALVAQGDQALAEADVLTEREDFGGAERALLRSLEAFRAGYALASAAQAGATARREAAEADRRDAARFAPSELGAAKDLHFRGDQAFRRGAHEEARQLYVRAASSYRAAARTGSHKSEVADARDRAQDLRTELLQALSQAQRTPLLRAALDDFDRAEAHYDQHEFEPARELYVKVAETLERVRQVVPKIQEAFGAQARVRRLREEAQDEMAPRFASDEFSRGRQAELEGDRALTEDEADKALECYSDALYRYKRALARARPEALAKRECDALRADVLEHRQVWIDEELTWKPAFKEAEQLILEADEAETRAYWNGVKRKLLKARSKLRELPEIR